MNLLSDSSFDDYAMFERNMQTSGVRGEDPEQKRATISGENVLLTTEETAVGVNLHNLFLNISMIWNDFYALQHT